MWYNTDTSKSTTSASSWIDLKRPANETFSSGQTYIIYPAYAPSGSRTDVPTPDKHGMPVFEDLTLESPDKLKIKAYLMLHGASASGTDLEEAKKRPTILFLHANAGNMVRGLSLGPPRIL
jgi:hypothetical protein